MKFELEICKLNLADVVTNSSCASVDEFGNNNAGEGDGRE